MKNKRYRGSNVFIVLITFLLTSITASAQTTAGITGTITDAQRELQFGLKLL
jgi:hypothetical protein